MAVSRLESEVTELERGLALDQPQALSRAHLSRDLALRRVLAVGDTIAIFLSLTLALYLSGRAGAESVVR